MTALETAKALIGFGFRVLPCAADTKRPILKEWTVKASSEESDIIQWFNDPSRLVGVLCGADADLVVIDIDNKGAGAKPALKALVDEGWPPTFMVSTPSGGFHLYYRHPGGKVKTGTEWRPGVDIRADGGQVIGPGQATSKGEYRVIRDQLIAALPAEYAAKLQVWPGKTRSPKPYANSLICDETGPGVDLDAPAPEHGWNEELFRRACKVANQTSSLDAFSREVWRIHDTHFIGDKPMRKGEVEKIIDSASKYVQPKPLATSPEVIKAADTMQPEATHVKASETHDAWSATETTAEQAPEGDFLAVMQALNDDYAMIACPFGVWREKTHGMITTANMKELEARLIVAVPQPDKKGKPQDPKWTPAVLGWISYPGRRTRERLVYEPGQPRDTAEGNLNIWPGWGVESVQGDVSLWRGLLAHIFGDTDEGIRAAGWFEQWVAYPIQNPGAKLYQACIIWSLIEGSGKTLLGETIRKIYGRNGRTVSADDLRGSFNSAWAKGSQFLLGEEASTDDHRADEDVLKHLITGTEVPVREKFVADYYLRNCINFMFTSNHPNAFKMSEANRRYFVWHVRGGHLPVVRGRQVMEWANNGGAAALRHHLERVDLAGYDPQGLPMDTADKRLMVDDSRSGLDQALADLRDDGTDGQAVISEVIQASDLAARMDGTITAKKVAAGLRRLGAIARRVDTSRGKKRLMPVTRYDYWLAQDNTAWREEYEKQIRGGILM